jgi:hypothetical protein
MVTLKGRTFNIKATVNGGASLSDVAVKERWGRWLAIIFLGFKWLAICLKIKIPKKNMKKKQIKSHGAWICLPAIALIIINYPFYIIRM